MRVPKFIWVLMISLLLVINLGFPRDAIAQTAAIPVVEQTSGGSKLLEPNWEKLTFGNLPPIESSGGIPPMPEAKFKGLDWQAGQTPDEFLSLGSIDELGLQKLNIKDIEAITQQKLEQVQLPELPLIGKQSLSDLVKGIPGLEDFNVSEVLPIAQLIKENQTLLNQSFESISNLKIGEALAKVPKIQELKLETLIDPTKFGLKDIPGLPEAPLENFEGWENELIAQVPGLSRVPIAMAPGFPFSGMGGMMMRIDAVWSQAEGADQSSSPKLSMSGSKRHGFKVPCLEYDCAYGEFDDIENVGKSARGATEGQRWYSGKYQEVDGEGRNLGKAINGGKEPVGRFIEPFPLKVVLWEPDERTDTVTFAFFARFCWSTFGVKHCSPYFIGPIPFIKMKVNDLMLVGLLDTKTTQKSSIPTGASSNTTNSDPELQSLNAASKIPGFNCFQPTNAGENIIDMDGFATAIASVESLGSGGYGAIGVPTCDGSGNCGTALGAFQFMSYNPQAVSLIEARPGGGNWLKQVSKGYTPTQDEVMTYFPPMDQELAFRNSLTEYIEKAQTETDPTTGQTFTGNLERAAQMHYGGMNAQIDGTATDALGKLSIQNYGSKVGSAYADGGSTCPTPTTQTASAPGQQAEPGQQPSDPTSPSTGTKDLGKDSGKVSQVPQPAPSPGNSASPGAGSNPANPTASLSPSPTSTKSVPQRIYEAALQLKGMSTKMGPGGGKVACAWAVNKILVQAGFAPVGVNPNYVPSFVDSLRKGRGQKIALQNAILGDIIIAKGQEHIGICLTKGCTQVLSNSSKQQSFKWVSNAQFGGYYDASLNQPKLEEIYRLAK